jgi:L-alanine-DL-glutamate epimerase-like enolase superfamily enzyme
VNADVIEHVVKPMLVGQDPFYRERAWQSLKERQRLHVGVLSDKVLAAVDLALWDLAGRALNQPVSKLLGACRDKVKAYASTMCGDDLKGGLDTPKAYAEFALACKQRGYTAFKLHTWMPPMPGAPDPKRDVAACTAVRKAVGDEMVLMLDAFHHYSRAVCCIRSLIMSSPAPGSMRWTIQWTSRAMCMCRKSPVSVRTLTLTTFGHTDAEAVS